MHTILSKSNPYGADRYGFAWEHVPQHGKAHLDFGCNDGQFLHDLSKSKHVENLVGLDISRDYVKQAQQLYPELDVRHLTRTTPLPFADNTFDSISIGCNPSPAMLPCSILIRLTLYLDTTYDYWPQCDVVEMFPSHR